mmetsp:Transcript_10899/g.14691  ORF Transcript_10899/g.14691 Transcript_10899/m.14691 type:complete len:90 (-) Transcript_10899:74-343(-)
MQQLDEDDPASEGLGAALFANSLDFSDVLFNLKKAMKDHDEESLAAAIDVARELGSEFPFHEDLDKAEAFFNDLVQCPDGSFSLASSRE